MRRFLLLCICSFVLIATGYAQERTVSGKVTSAEDGSALPGVNVVIKGTTNGTVTDVDGNYRLNVSASGGTLVFSFIGLQTSEVTIGERAVVDVSLALDVTQLSEVVVTAYGIERPKDELTYASQSVKGEDLMIAQQTTGAQGLVGKVAGLQVNIQNNGVNPSSQLLLRGLRSISANNSALIIIDGAVASQGAFDDLNPNDIESVNALKGANAAALYGSNAANGALVITTKSGKNQNKFNFGLNSTFTLQEVAYMPDFQTKHGIGWAGNYDPIENTNWGPRFDGVTRRIGPIFPDGSFQAVPYAPIKDNLKDFFETGKTSQHTFYFTGGNENSKFYLSVGNQTTSGIVPDDEYKRTTLRVNASQRIGKVDLSVNSSFLTDETNVVGNTIGDQDRPLYWFVLNTAANIPLTNYKDWNNPLSYGYADNYYNAYYQNPYWAIGTNRNIDNSARLVANVAAAYHITDNINWETRMAVNTTSGYGKNWRARQTYNPDLQPAHSTVSSFVEESEFQDTEYNGNSIFSGDFKLQSDISLKALLGAQFIQRKVRESQIRANNLSIPDFYDISNGTGQLVGFVDELQRRQFGFFSDVTVGYKNYAFLNLTGRQDYTSTLPSDNNSYFYPAVGVSFVASEAIDAIKSSNVLSYLKLIVSNSTVYNDLNPYQVNERYTQPATFPLGDVNGFVLDGTTVDAAIKKEKLNTTEFGANIGFLRGRFNLDANYFITKTTDLITRTTPSRASGATAFLTNIGELEGKGLELSLGGNILKIGGLSWDLNINYTAYETVVNEIKDDLKEVGLDVYAAGYGTYAIVGEAFPQIKAASYTRDPQGRVVVGSDGNPIVGEVLAMGKATPDYILGGASQMSFKGVSLSATFDYRTGHVYYEQGSDQMEFTGRSVASVSSNRQDFIWPNSVIEVSEGNFVENTDRPITGGTMLFWQNRYNEIKENYVKDATAFKIREVAISYNVPKSILSNLKVVNKLSVGFVARNLLTILPEENRFSDPEFNNATEGGRVLAGNYNGNSIGIGGYLQSPPTRSYGFNLNIEF